MGTYHSNAKQIAAFNRFNRHGFTIIELLVAIAIMCLIAAGLFLVIHPVEILENSRIATTRASLEEVAEAATIFNAVNGYYPADVNRNIPNDLLEYLGKGAWPAAPFPNSVYDWDNWENQTCWDGSTGIIQVTVRQIPLKGKTNYTLYYVIKGKGIPHCSDSSAKGECSNCPSRYP